jgi:hypothetical protein
MIAKHAGMKLQTSDRGHYGARNPAQILCALGRATWSAAPNGEATHDTHRRWHTTVVIGEASPERTADARNFSRRMGPGLPAAPPDGPALRNDRLPASAIIWLLGTCCRAPACLEHCAA